MMQSKTAPDGRPVVEVVLGILIDQAKGVYLMGSRPQGKPYAGYWEFPGGKVEPGERYEDALKREFVEELGVKLTDMTPWFVLEHAYEHAYVRLHYYRVWDWEKEPTARENQQFAWFKLGEYDQSIQMLPMNALVVRRMVVPAVLGMVSDPQSDIQTPEAFKDVKGLVITPDQAQNQSYVNALNTLAQKIGLDVYCPQVVTGLEQATTQPMQETLFALVKDCDAKPLLKQQTQRVPLVVPAELKELSQWIKYGAHGIYLKL